MELENEKLIRRFLFGEMPEEERFDFEERFITDANVFEEIKVVEDELIEKYVRGWMDSAERDKFEQHFLTTKKRRERVEFSRQLIQNLKGQKDAVVVPVKKNEPAVSEKDSFWDKLIGFLFTPKFALAGGFALIIAILGSWLIYQNFGDGNNEFVKKEDPTTTETPVRTVTPKPVDSPVTNQNTDDNDNQNSTPETPDNSINQTDNNNVKNKTPGKTPTPKENDRKAKPTPFPQKTPPVRKVAPNPILAVFAGSVRSGGKNNVLNLPEEATAATLQLNLESIDYKTYQARLTDQDGNVVYQQGNLKIRNSRINFNIPAKNLKRGDYIIKLFGKNDGDENESVADFQIRVNR